VVLTTRVATLHAIRRPPELRRAWFRGAPGFVVAALAAALTATGDAVLSAVRQWEITDLKCDR